MKYSCYSLAIVCLIFIGCTSTKKLPLNSLDEKGLQTIFYLKNKFLVDGDQRSLKTLIHPQVAYCHSNCWYEDFTSLMKSDTEKKLDYKNITVSELFITVVNTTGIVRGKANFEINMNGNDVTLSLCFVEAYVYENKKWWLLTRQSSKVPDTK